MGWLKVGRTPGALLSAVRLALMLILPSPVFLLLLLCCCSKSGISRKVSRQVKAPPSPHQHQHLPTFICEATAILMKLDCVRPRHRKLSPDGRWTDMEFESAENGKAGIYQKKRGGRGAGGGGGEFLKSVQRDLSPCIFLLATPNVNLKKLLSELK